MDDLHFIWLYAKFISSWIAEIDRFLYSLLCYWFSSFFIYDIAVLFVLPSHIISNSTIWQYFFPFYSYSQTLLQNNFCTSIHTNVKVCFNGVERHRERWVHNRIHIIVFYSASSILFIGTMTQPTTSQNGDWDRCSRSKCFVTRDTNWNPLSGQKTNKTVAQDTSRVFSLTCKPPCQTLTSGTRWSSSWEHHHRSSWKSFSPLWGTTSRTGQSTPASPSPSSSPTAFSLPTPSTTNSKVGTQAVWTLSCLSPVFMSSKLPKNEPFFKCTLKNNLLHFVTHLISSDAPPFNLDASLALTRDIVICLFTCNVNDFITSIKQTGEMQWSV